MNKEINMESNFNYLYFDIFSKRASFFYNNQEKIGSHFGLFLTLIYISFSLILFLYNLVITSQRKELKVYDSTMNSQEMPSININSDNFYFAFGLEDPNSLNRFVDETVYYPEILFIERNKVKGKFVTNTTKNLAYENCQEKNFGNDYQHLFIKGELNNSYCLKDFNYNLTLAGGFKYEKMTYIRIKLFPCKNSTENNYHCKPQEKIDYYLSSTYFSILIKNFGLNPSNYSFPIQPKVENLFTTVDKILYRNLILNFGMTEIHTDKGLFNENIDKKKYLQYREAMQTFSFSNINDYLNGKEICMIQLKLDDTIFIQKRTYTKIPEIFSRMGGYMQLMHTAFSLLSLIINKFDSELKIINSIFNFNLQKKKMALKYQSLRDFDSINIPIYNKNLIFSSRKSVKNIKKVDNSKSNNLIIMDSNISSIFNISHNNRRFDDCQSSKLEINKSKNSIYESNNFKIIKKNSRRSKYNKSENLYNNVNHHFNNDNNIQHINVFYNKKESNNNLNEFNDQIRLNLLDYFCKRNNNQNKKAHFDLYNLGISFYRKTMDLIHIFTLLLITERILLKKNK